MEKQFRYPGARPFSEEDRKLFFGRDADIRALSARVALEPLVVLFGKSGYGKTSLLQAGVLPRLRDTENHRILELRFNEPDKNPLDLVLEQLKTHLGAAPFLGDTLQVSEELPDDLSALLWCYLKSLQIAGPETPWNTLVFDQFEELFHFHQPHVESFGRALADVLRPKPPKAIRRIIKAHHLSGAGTFTESDLESWLAPLNCKVLLSVRHDHLGSLDALKPNIPYIFRHTYELKPLNGMQALEALQKPAALEGPYTSPVFTYSQGALDKILSSLKDKRTQRIETFQLQLIAQHAEEAIMAKAQKQPGAASLELTPSDLGNPETIFEDHYREIIEGLPRKNRGKARNLVESRLIINGNRIPLPERLITHQYQVPVALLNTLVERRLLRSQLDSTGGTSLELSHDTLVAPIQKTARKHRQKVLWRRLRLAGLLMLLAIVGFASWGIVEYREIKSLEGQIDSLNGVIRNMPRDTVTNTLVGEVTVIDSLVLLTEQQRDSLEGLRQDLDSIGGIARGVRIDTVFIDDTGKSVTPPAPINDNIAVKLPAQWHSEWIDKLNALKGRVRANPDAEYTGVASRQGSSDSRGPSQWEFAPGDVHLVAVRINTARRIFDARNPKAYFILLANEKVYRFLGGTGYFADGKDLAFLPKGQHLLRKETTEAGWALMPYRNGVQLIRDLNSDGSLSGSDITNGFYNSPQTDVAIRWITGNTIDQPGQQLIFDRYYLNAFNNVVGGNDGSGTTNAFNIFGAVLWNHPEGTEVHYTVVDLSDFSESQQEEIIRDINRLKTGLD
ncbi:nSTAND1 domain-containing NTPase [Robiginitalea sediminis]|uniref:nSTAND1 domain-containing NTPase n=1 Tax=Robiginitalea sediminis TaxID=1982593 RepID=UPI00117AD94A|nr:ATP-binding protein [Robiginitalea sediminis]